MVPQNIEKCKSLQEFKILFKVWKPEAWKYVANIGLSYCIFKLMVNKVFNSIQFKLGL